jgi:predicted ATP-grasp superfamily ATP-dependent carboligase
VRCCADETVARAAAVQFYQQAPPYSGELLIQPLIPGRAASVAAVGNGQGTYRILPACDQQIEFHPSGSWQQLRYCGSQLIVSAELRARADRLAQAALAQLPPARGYLGIDLLLDNVDRVVEINARLTSSYLELRRHVGNLAPAMLDAMCLATGWQPAGV